VEGQLAGSSNLFQTLNQSIRDSDADRRALLLGGHVAKRRRRKKAQKRGARVLAGVVDRRSSLKGTLRGKEFKASLRRDGAISYRKRLFVSPSAAGKAAVRRNVNGWTFWRYREKSGRWVPLKQLRG
jgi:hypothetical protein